MWTFFFFFSYRLHIVRLLRRAYYHRGTGVFVFAVPLISVFLLRGRANESSKPSERYRVCFFFWFSPEDTPNLPDETQQEPIHRTWQEIRLAEPKSTCLLAVICESTCLGFVEARLLSAGVRVFSVKICSCIISMWTGGEIFACR